MQFLLYIILAITLLAFGLVVLLAKFNFPKSQHILIERVLVFVLIAVFAVRYIGFKDVHLDSGNYLAFSSFDGPLGNPFLDTIANLAIWIEITAIIGVFLRPFFHFKTIKWFIKFIATPFLVFAAVVLPLSFFSLQGSNDVSLLMFLYPIEIGLALAICFHYWLKDAKVRISKHSYAEVAIFSVLINFASMPSYIPSFLFGLGYYDHHIYDLSVYHRIYIYLFLIALPFGIYFGLRKAHQDKIRYTILFISLATSITYLASYKYDVWMEIWRWPWHLCNMAMIVLPICLIFNFKRLFYFTYFINVFGAAMALFMPDYASGLTIFNPHVIMFWANHVTVFILPILCVALRIFERPKMKQYFYSTIWFAGYYLIILILNPLFGALGHPSDYLFINSMFIADKLGEWAKDIFRLSFTFNIGDLVFEFHPLYQFLYFSIYILIGFGVWFIYQLGFDIADKHYALHLKLKGIRIDRLALKSALNGRSLKEPMEGNVGIKLELKHFSKKYGLSKYYAVEDANLEVKGGEVFGFLGPNGAGKSTIIKSIVGIQPISEGEIFVCGYNVKSQPVYAKSQIGFVPDHYALYEKLTGREYLNYIADIYEVSKADRDERLAKYIHLFELEESIDNKIKTYSHGMKQKVTIIAALIHNPKVWILDEPLTGLDPTSIFQVKECMRKHAEEGNIVFFSSHLIDIVEKLCDRIAIIKHGHIQCVKDVSTIEKSGVTLEEFYMSQIGDNTVEEKGKEKKSK